MHYLARLCVIACLILLGTSAANAQASREEYIEYACDYILKYNHFSKSEGCPHGVDSNLTSLYDEKRNVVGPDYVLTIATIFWEVEEEFYIPHGILLTISRFETGFRIWRSGDGGKAVGLLQIRKDYHQCRFKGYKRENETYLWIDGDKVIYSFDWTQERDRTRYGAWLIKRALLSGKSLYSSISPWSVRGSAWKAYKEVKKYLDD